ncbi:DNA repair protein RadC [Chloroflexota bacterium]
MEEKTRKTGVPVIGAAPWGTHLCQFYVTRQDLVDILVPYFQAGLENNEFCIWVTSELLNEKEAGEAMRKAMPDFTRYLGRGQIEIVPHTEWYVKDGAFSGERVLKAWIDKLNQALAKGYEGMRITGNMAWLDEKTWGDFTDYEEAVNNTIGDHRMIAICSYPLDKCKISQVVDVVSNHQLALIKRAGNWVSSKPKEGQKITPQAISRRRLTSLQERFVKTGFMDLSDQEIIELLISQALPYRESHKVAKDCLAEFKDLSVFLAASPEDLERVGITSSGMFFIKLLHELPAEILKKKIIEHSFYKSSKEVFDYLYYSMRDLNKEVLKAIYLDRRNQIIDTADLFEGSLETIPIRPREIVENAILRGAAAIIFVHNHPSGDPAPSKSDKQFTRDLAFVGQIIQIKVLDHIIIGGNNYFSFADEGLINKYELDFLNFKIRAVSDGGASHTKK